MDRRELKGRVGLLGYTLKSFAAWIGKDEDTVYHWKEVPLLVHRLVEYMERENGKVSDPEKG